MIAKHAHKQTLHGSVDLTLAFIRQNFWILNARDLVRKIVHSCVSCIRYAKSKRPPIMGDLPTERITPSRPFTLVGVDFAGPFELKSSKRKTTERKA